MQIQTSWRPRRQGAEGLLQTHQLGLGIQQALKKGLGSWKPLPEQASPRVSMPNPSCAGDHALFREHFVETSPPSMSEGSQNLVRA